MSGTFSLTSVLYSCGWKSKIGSCESGEKKKSEVRISVTCIISSGCAEKGDQVIVEQEKE